ncbi:hypothetical protein F5884DRAFT_672828 [Xylogone sp. PMI_703]|nr:hypothetical protein F5884DRAFT_672828 [Xylogone sp. PMI_703]
MNRHSSLRGTSAPYGHACANCARSKCKCIIRLAGEPCERCYRLKKDCHTTESVRKRGRRKPIVTKTARLEEKLDGLVSLIKASKMNGVLHQNILSMDMAMPYNMNTNMIIRSQAEDSLISTPDSSVYHETGSPYYDSPSVKLSSSQAEEYLLYFQDYMSQYFPFVHIASTTTTLELQKERPFLWLCIMMASSKSTSQQQLLKQKIRQIVAQEMVVDSEKRIDLLLGLLAFIGWANYEADDKPFRALFSQLAISLVFDLGLNKPIPKDNQLLPCGTSKFSSHRTMEERRAVLGCFLITSSISLFLHKVDTLRWTPHMDECLQILEQKRECPNDEILVQQVRLALIAEKSNQVASLDEAAASLYHESLQLQLQGIKADILSNFQENKVLLLHLYSTELEVALSPTFLHTNILTLQGRKSIRGGLEAIKSWLGVFLTISPAAYIGFPFSILSQLILCLMTLYRLKNFDDPPWDKNGVWESTDALLTLDHIITNMEQVGTLASLDRSDSQEGDQFSRSARYLRTLRPGWEAKLAADNALLPTVPALHNVDEMSLLDPFGMELFDSWFIDASIPQD